MNAELVLLNSQIGNCLQEERAEYVDQIVSTLWRQLTTEYGGGFSRENLLYMGKEGSREAMSEHY